MFLQIFEMPPRAISQPQRSYDYACVQARKSAAISLLACANRSTWIWLSYVYKQHVRPILQRRAARAAVLLRISTPPKPLSSYDVGLDPTTGEFIFRSCTGTLHRQHPAGSANIEVPSRPAPPDERSYAVHYTCVNTSSVEVFIRMNTYLRLLFIRVVNGRMRRQVEKRLCVEAPSRGDAGHVGARYK